MEHRLFLMLYFIKRIKMSESDNAHLSVVWVPKPPKERAQKKKQQTGDRRKTFISSFRVCVTMASNQEQEKPPLLEWSTQWQTLGKLCSGTRWRGAPWLEPGKLTGYVAYDRFSERNCNSLAPDGNAPLRKASSFVDRERSKLLRRFFVRGSLDRFDAESISRMLRASGQSGFGDRRNRIRTAQIIDSRYCVNIGVIVS
ncbi:uncharacterized protein LOC118507995 [Anopheles stephensi]|uniref:uncharacterized protein LOC118507995 n=1 Tax=Anopheles stephensi TaxID=30069 RepID=UPI001658B570|nr:uncharacterized protein LOC118507995 [Anopheles stephensi]